MTKILTLLLSLLLISSCQDDSSKSEANATDVDIPELLPRPEALQSASPAPAGGEG